MATNISTLRVQLTASTGRFTRAMHGARQPVASFASSVAGAGRRLLGFGTVASGLLLGGGAMYALKRTFDSIDDLAKKSDALGIATENLARLQHAASLSGVEVGAFDKALRQMSRGIAEAASGTGEAKDAISRIGLDASKLLQMPLEKQFLEIAAAMEHVTNASERVSIAYDLFGGRGVSVLNVLAMGRQGLIETARDADRLGLSISRIDAMQVEMANDAITRLKSAMQGVVNVIAIQMSPIITAGADKLVEMGTAGEGMAAKIVDGVEMAVTAIAHVGNTVNRVRMFFKAVNIGVLYGIKAITNAWVQGHNLVEMIWASFPALVALAMKKSIQLVQTFANKAIALLNKVPGIDIAPVVGGGNIEQYFQRMFDKASKRTTQIAQRGNQVHPMVASLQDSLTEIKAEYDALKNARPVEDVRQWFDNLRKRSRDAAKAAIAKPAPIEELAIPELPEVDGAVQGLEKFGDALDKTAAKLEGTFIEGKAAHIIPGGGAGGFVGVDRMQQFGIGSATPNAALMDLLRQIAVNTGRARAYAVG